MKHALVWVDQSIGIALRRSLSQSQIEMILEKLQLLKVQLVDVWVTDWLSHQPATKSVPDFLRGKIHVSQGELLQAHQLGFQKVIVSYHHSAGQSLSENLYAILSETQKLKLEVSLCVENASEVSVHEIHDFWPLCVKYTIKSLIYMDQTSRLDPWNTYEILNALQKNAPCQLEFHAHNTYGLATANSLGAIKAGVRQIATSIAGIGSSGHAALEEVMMGSKYLLQELIEDQSMLAATCTEIAVCMGLQLPTTKAIIGRDIFAHESGIHVDGIMKNPKLYEAFPPGEVGLIRKMVIGKHSGTASLKAKFKEWDIELSQDEASSLLQEVRSRVVKQKNILSDEQLKELYHESLFSR